VRLQALVRGRVVRKQLTVTVKCMQALVRVQARARDRRTRLSADSSQGGDALDDRATHADPVKDAEVLYYSVPGYRCSSLVHHE
jgi:hypothetical protein